MQTTFARVANNTTNGVALGAADQDIVVYDVFVGLPANGNIVTLYDVSNPVNNSNTDVVWRFTMPTFSTTNINPGSYHFHFPQGLPLRSGGNLMVDGTNNVTVVWEYGDAVGV